jgi:hypothetical protein
MSNSLRPSSGSQPQEESATVNPSSQGLGTGASKAIIKNWKTTAIGLTISLSGFVAFSPSTFGGEQAPLVQICKYITAGGLGALGICSKDFNVTGGSEN